MCRSLLPRHALQYKRLWVSSHADQHLELRHSTSMFSASVLSLALALASSAAGAALPTNGTHRDALEARSNIHINGGQTATSNVVWASGDSRCDAVVLSPVRGSLLRAVAR